MRGGTVGNGRIGKLSFVSDQNITKTTVQWGTGCIVFSGGSSKSIL